MWAVEPCNRPWDEYEVNAFEFAKDKFWQTVGGMEWQKEADFEPVFLAHGPSQGKDSWWISRRQSATGPMANTSTTASCSTGIRTTT